MADRPISSIPNPQFPYTRLAINLRSELNRTTVIVTDKMMWLDEHKKNNNNNESNNINSLLDVSDADSDSSGEELPIWVRGEQRWVSGVAADTTCQEVIQVLLQDEEGRVRKS